MNSFEKIVPVSVHENSSGLGGAFSALHSAGKYLAQQANLLRFYGDISFALGRQSTKAITKIVQTPERTAQHHIEWLDQQLDLLRDTSLGAWRRIFAPKQSLADQPGIAHDDARFANPSWHTTSFFRWLHQSYLINSNTLLSLVNGLGMKDPLDQKQAEYFTRQLVSALSPSNYVMTNPQLLQETLSQRGMNLVHGARSLARHFDSSWDGVNLPMADTTGFRLGENIAATKGAVVFQNELFQLIQYEPTTASVWKRPLLIVPPCVNKYYIMDLGAQNSMIKWFVEQGHSVFVMSWVNPDETYRHVRFENYLLRGPMKALDVVCDICETDEINAIGYCLGGTMLGMLLSYLQQHNDQRIKSATYFNALFNYGEPGELAAFLTEPMLGALERYVRSKGYHDGRIMAFSFNTLAENALLWPFFTDNFIRDHKPPAFDLLYWNTDNTNIPAEMYLFFLREIYQHNKLATPGAISIAGTPVDISIINVPSYFVAAEKDHITPWHSTYRNTRIVRGPSRFILSGSGHIAGIINPPSANKYGYKTNDATPPDADEWLRGASSHEGSWWPDWQRWCESLNVEKIAARALGNRNYCSVEAAPGSYVRKRLVPLL